MKDRTKIEREPGMNNPVESILKYIGLWRLHVHPPFLNDEMLFNRFKVYDNTFLKLLNVGILDSLTIC